MDKMRVQSRSSRNNDHQNYGRGGDVNRNPQRSYGDNQHQQRMSSGVQRSPHQGRGDEVNHNRSYQEHHNRDQTRVSPVNITNQVNIDIEMHIGKFFFNWAKFVKFKKSVFIMSNSLFLYSLI